MKTAIYIEDGTTQIVITPETDFEKTALKAFGDQPMTAQLFAGSFYDCRGGWIRQSSYWLGPHGQGTDQSLMIRVDKAATAS